jgi:hypothetical protein
MSDAAKRAMLEKALKIDFEAMTEEEWSAWINGLPQEEFFALLALPNDGPLFKEAGDEMPVPADEQIFVTYEDGGIDGPNRADAFIWGEADPMTRITAYAPIF